MYVINWIGENIMMRMSLELVDNYNIPFLNS